MRIMRTRSRYSLIILYSLIIFTIIIVWGYALLNIYLNRKASSDRVEFVEHEYIEVFLENASHISNQGLITCYRAYLLHDSIDIQSIKKELQSLEKNYIENVIIPLDSLASDSTFFRHVESMNKQAKLFFNTSQSEFISFLEEDDQQGAKRLLTSQLLKHYHDHQSLKSDLYDILHYNREKHIETTKMFSGKTFLCITIVSIASLFLLTVLIGLSIISIRRGHRAQVQNEMKYRTIANYTYDWEFWLNPDGTYKHVSPSAFRITGYYSEDFINDPQLFDNLIHPDDRSEVLKHTNRMIQGIEDFYHLDFRIITRKGDIRWISQYAQPIRDVEDVFIGIRGSNRDFTQRKMADIALRESEERFRVLAESTPDGVFVHDNRSIIYCNPAGIKMLGGKGINDIIGKSIQIFIEDDEMITKRLDEISELGEAQLNEQIIKRLDNKIIHVETYTAPIQWQNEMVHQTIIRDITKRREAEAGRREAEKRYKSLFQDSLSVMLIFDPVTGNIIDVNKSACMFYGYKYKELVNQNIKKIIGSKYKANHENKKKNENYTHFRGKHILSNKQEADVEIYSGIISIDEHEFVYWIVHNISERIRAEQALRESEEKFRTIFDMSTSAIFITDLKGKFIEVNNTACKMLEYAKEELIQLEPTDISTTPKKSEYDGRVDELIQTDQLLFGTTFLSKSGKTIPIEATSSIVKYQDKKTILTIVNDITEREQMHNRLLRTILKTEEKERKRFATDLHDGMGSLLSSICIYLDLLKQEGLELDERLNLTNYTIGLVNEAITSSKEIANDLRPSTISKFGLLPSLRTFCDKINQTGALHISLDTDKFVAKLGDNTEVILFRIINELINNTIQHSAAKNIEIKLSNTTKTLNLSYSDDGIGFDVEKVMNDVSRGSGITNIISRTRSLSGECSIRSTLGKGSEYLISFALNMQEKG